MDFADRVVGAIHELPLLQDISPTSWRSRRYVNELKVAEWDQKIDRDRNI